MLPSCDEKPKEKATLRGDGGAGLGAARGGDSWEHALRAGGKVASLFRARLPPLLTAEPRLLPGGHGPTRSV